VKTEYNERNTRTNEVLDENERWEEFKDVIPNFLDTSLKSDTLFRAYEYKFIDMWMPMYLLIWHPLVYDMAMMSQ